MPVWATVVLTIIGGLIGVGGTLGATILQQRHESRVRRENERAQLIAQLGAVAGRLRSLLDDAEPTRVGVRRTLGTRGGAG
jgi:hypothetical protein